MDLSLSHSLEGFHQAGITITPPAEHPSGYILQHARLADLAAGTALADDSDELRAERCAVAVTFATAVATFAFAVAT